MRKMKKGKVLYALMAVALLLVGLILLFQFTSSTKVFSVAFDTDGGSSIATQRVTSSKVAVIERPIDPTREGYKFVYWELEGKEFDFSNPILSDLALVAKWEPITYDVLFNSNGGTVLPSQTIVYGGSISKPSNPTRDGFIFVGWFLSDEEYDFTKVVESDLELFAKWEADETGSGGFEPNTDSVVTTKTETKTFVIAYKTVKQNDSTLEEGKTIVKQEGQNGEITITYTVTYTDGKETSRTETSRKINKQPVNKIILVGTKDVVKERVDTTAPIITLLGNTTENVANGATYTDAGAIATDNVDGNITARIAVAGDKVNTAVAGTYVVTYNVSDAAGNAAKEVTRTVIVAEAIKVSWITVTPTTIHKTESFPQIIHATIFPENATNKNVVWSSSNTSAVTVVDGEVAIRDFNYWGIVIITATTIDGSKTATTLVSLVTVADTHKFWTFNETFKGDKFDTFDLTKEEDLRVIENRLNSEHFDRMAVALPQVEGKDFFLERYTSFRTKVNVARATFNDLQIATAKELISGVTYTMTQETATDEAIIKSTVESTIAREISAISLYNEVVATVNKGEYTPAVAGDAVNPTGINGIYTFTVEVSNSSATGSTATLAMTIFATPFVDRP